MLTKTKRLSMLLGVSLLLSACGSTNETPQTEKPEKEVGATLADDMGGTKEVDAKLKATLQAPNLEPVFENDFVRIQYIQKTKDVNIDTIGSNIQLQYSFVNKTERKQTMKFENIKVDGKEYTPTEWALQVPVDTEKLGYLIFYKYQDYRGSYEKEVKLPSFKKELTADYTIIDYETSKVLDKGTFKQALTSPDESSKEKDEPTDEPTDK